VIASDEAVSSTHSAAEIVLRPTRIRLQEPDPGAALSGAVISVTYAGESWAARLDLGAGIQLTARGPASAQRPRPGERLGIAWQDEDARVFLRRTPSQA
jgi:ABC-type Fe3+/spermidine/putrescine transport system ATPase subunit